MSGMEQNLEVKWQYKSTGIPDNLFSRSKAGLTREEIRSIIASKARIEGNEREHGKIWVE